MYSSPPCSGGLSSLVSSLGSHWGQTSTHWRSWDTSLWAPVIYDLCTQLLQWTRPSSVAAGKRLMNTDLHYMGEIDTLWDPVIYDLCTQLLQWTRPSSVAAGKRLMKTDLHYMGEMRHSMSSSDLWLVYSAPPVNQAFLSGCREETNEDRPPLHGGDETLYELQWSMTCVLSSSSEPGLPQWLQGRD